MKNKQESSLSMCDKANVKGWSRRECAGFNLSFVPHWINNKGERRL